MGLEFSWRTKRGQLSENNWDYCGIGLRPDSSLCIVLDGSTSGTKSGDLAQQIATRLIDWFVELKASVTTDAIIDQLGKIHEILALEFRSASASYAIVLIEAEKTISVLHAGDCLVGRDNGHSPAIWETRPHTLVNAIESIPVEEVAKSPLRHQLTRSFRAREFLKPEVCSIDFEGDQMIVVGTDGFWADLDPDGQNKFLDGDDPSKEAVKDDCSALKITKLTVPQVLNVSCHASENIYFVDCR